MRRKQPPKQRSQQPGSEIICRTRQTYDALLARVGGRTYRSTLERQQTHRQIREHREGAAQEGDEVTQVVAGLVFGLWRHPVVICQLKKLVNFLVQAGVDLLLSGMAGVLPESRVIILCKGKVLLYSAV